ncbi:MAG: hypothetical protein ACFB6R_02450 [Alphaproteobacteria bacterium]
MSKRGAGPNEEPFEIFFAEGRGEIAIWLAGGFALALILSGFILADPILMLTSLMPMAVSAYHLPMARNDHPQLVISARGITIDGLGHMDWEEIQNVDLWEPAGLDHSAFGTETLSELIVETASNIEFTIDPQQDMSLIRTFQVMVWRLEELNIVRVRLGPLDVDPDALVRRARTELRHSRGWIS